MLFTTFLPVFALFITPHAIGSVDIAPPPAPAYSCALSGEERRDFEIRLNRLRESHGLRPVSFDGVIRASAAEHSLDMAAHGELAHKGSDGADFVARLRRARYAPYLGAENVAWNQRSVGEVIDDWHASPPHRRAMLDPDVSQFGLARACSDKGEPYWTLVLARPFGTV